VSSLVKAEARKYFRPVDGQAPAARQSNLLFLITPRECSEEQMAGDDLSEQNGCTMNRRSLQQPPVPQHDTAWAPQWLWQPMLAPRSRLAGGGEISTSYRSTRAGDQSEPALVLR